jgi:hypothetical protein
MRVTLCATTEPSLPPRYIPEKLSLTTLVSLGHLGNSLGAFGFISGFWVGIG